MSCSGWIGKSHGTTEKCKSKSLQKIGNSPSQFGFKKVPFLNCMDNRLASLLDPRFKQKWIENDDEKEEALRVLQTHVTSRLGSFQEDCSSSNSTDDDNGSLAKEPKLFDFIAEGSKKKNPKNSRRQVEIYFAKDILHFDEDPLKFWKKKSEELPTLAVLAKEFLD